MACFRVDAGLTALLVRRCFDARLCHARAGGRWPVFTDGLTARAPEMQQRRTDARAHLFGREGWDGGDGGRGGGYGRRYGRYVELVWRPIQQMLKVKKHLCVVTN